MKNRKDILNKNKLNPSSASAIINTILTNGYTIIISFLSGIIITRTLGPTAKGELAILMTTVSFILPFMGLFTDANAILLGENTERQGALLNNTVIGAIFIVSLSISIYLVLSNNLKSFFSGNSEISNLFLLVPLLIFRLNSLGISGLLKAKQLFSFINQINQINATLILILASMAFFFFELNVRAVLLIYCFTAGISAIASGAKIFNKKSFSAFKFDKHIFFAGLPISLRAMVSGIPLFLLFKVDIWMINYFTSMKHVGIYHLAVNISELVLIVGNSVNHVMMGKAVSEAGGEKAAILATKVLLLIGFICFLVLIIFGRKFFGLYGPAFVDSYLPSLFVLLGVYFFTITAPLAAYVQGKAKYPIYLAAYIWIALLVNIVLNIWLIPKFAEVGAAMTTSISYLIASIGYLIKFSEVTRFKWKQILFFSKEDFYLIYVYLKRTVPSK